MSHGPHFGRGRSCSYTEIQSVYSTVKPNGPQDTHGGEGGLTPLQRCNQCILQLQPNELQATLWWGGVLLLCRDAVGLFYNQAEWATSHRPLFGVGSYSFAEMQSVYSTEPAEWTTDHSLWGGLTHLQRCSQCILQPSRMGHRTLVVGSSYSFAEIQSVYSTAPADVESPKKTNK